MDNATLESWYETYSKDVKRIVAKRHYNIPAHLMDDVVQETWVRLQRLVEDPSQINDPASYLITAARHVAHELNCRSRYQREHLPIETYFDELNNYENEPEVKCSQKEEQDKLLKLFKRLSIRQQQVLRLQFYEGKTYKEIADHLKISPRIVMRDIRHAYLFFREHMQ